MSIKSIRTTHIILIALHYLSLKMLQHCVYTQIILTDTVKCIWSTEYSTILNYHAESIAATSDTEVVCGPAGTIKGYSHTLCCAIFPTHPHILQSSLLCKNWYTQN